MCLKSLISDTTHTVTCGVFHANYGCKAMIGISLSWERVYQKVINSGCVQLKMKNGMDHGVSLKNCSSV